MLQHLDTPALLTAIWAISALALTATGAEAQVPRPEHPRPDMERAGWLNLNGQWQFEIDNENTGEGRGLATGQDLSGTITVPFCPESTLSGIGNTDFMTRVWYRRHFAVPEALQGKRLLLHFDAVDYEARVWLNGQYLGSHKGGYTPFAFDITEAVSAGENELVLQARDDTRSGRQGTGKQSFGRSEGCVYTRTTGIWQTVWLEAVGETWVKEAALTPDPDGERALVQLSIGGPSEGRFVRLTVMDQGRVVSEEVVPAAWRSTLAVLRVPNPVLWEPGAPHLYDLNMVVEQDGKVVDEVRSYFGMRKVSIEGNQFLINGKRVFQRTVLDQGFYPDGIYTAPTDEALRGDIELSMAAGFNGARLHQKVFEPRFLYWADKLGYIVWGEYPSWGVSLANAAALTQVVVEWHEILRRDRNHPAIVGWCPLNETGGDEGAAMAQQLLAVSQLVDPTRPFLDTSGYVHMEPGTDIYDCHNYDQNPQTFRALYDLFSVTGQEPWNNFPGDPRGRYQGQPYFVSEYGGTRLTPDGEQGGAWGYGASTQSIEEFLARYKGLTDALLDNPNMFGFCYTQLTDVEQEQNGVYFYDRRPKYDPALLKAINERAAAYELYGPRVRKLDLRDLAPTSAQTPQTWRYTTEAPADNWMQPGFDDTGWQTGPGGFGTASTPGAVVGTEWNGPDIWLRRTFAVEGADWELLMLSIHHDEDAEVYVNGQLVASFGGYTVGYGLCEATDKLRAALKPGENLLAVHCKQTVGGQFIDVGIRGQ